jgi:hypothetical protein
MKKLLLTILFAGCAQADMLCPCDCVPVTPTAAPTVTPTRTATPIPTATHTPIAQPTVKVINYTESQAIIGNPDVGFQTTRRVKSQVSNPRNIPLLHATFRTCAHQVNPSPGVFNWSEIDSFLTAAAADGQTVQLRLIMYDPYDCGGWLRNTIPSTAVFCSTENPGRTYYMPNWDAVAVQGAHRSLIQAFAAKYNNDPRVDSVDLGSLGDYAEHHHSCLKNKATGAAIPAPSDAARRAIIKDYHDSFTNKPIIHILDDFYDPNITVNPVGRQEAVARNAGWRADCWGGHHEDTLYPNWLSNPSDMLALWQRGPVHLEPCGNQTGTGYMSIMRKVDEAIEKHTSLINSKNNIQFTDAQWPEWQRLLRKLGYRFVVRSARIDGGTTFTIENVGIAPNYSPITLKYAGETKTLERIMPGTVVQRSFTATAGTLTADMRGRMVKFANNEEIRVQ